MTSREITLSYTNDFICGTDRILQMCTEAWLIAQLHIAIYNDRIERHFHLIYECKNAGQLAPVEFTRMIFFGLRNALSVASY